MKSILLLIAPKDFRDEEVFITKEELERRGCIVHMASSHVGECIGSKGGKATAELTTENIRCNDYEALVIAGGSGSQLFFEDPTVHRLVNEFYQSQKIVAAICIAPMILAKAGILKGKRASVFSSETEALELLGAHYTGMDVTVDGNIITAYGPQSALRFAKKIAEHLHQIPSPQHQLVKRKI